MSTSENVVIRSMGREDAPAVYKMMKDLARFENSPDYPQFTVEELIQDGFETSPPWYTGLVATRSDGQLCGYAIYNRSYSTWTRCAFFLEDLYVTPDTRNAGVAPLLLQRLCQIALEQGVTRLDGEVLESNTRARSFYRRIGARDVLVEEGRVAMTLDRGRLEAIPAGDLHKLSPQPIEAKRLL